MLSVDRLVSSAQGISQEMGQLVGQLAQERGLSVVDYLALALRSHHQLLAAEERRVTLTDPSSPKCEIGIHS